MRDPANPDALRRRGLLEAARAGGVPALEELLAELARALRPACHRIAGAAWGDDALQEALVEICRTLDRFDPARDPLPLARTIAARRALDLRRRERARGLGRNAGEGAAERVAAPAAPEPSGLLALLERLEENDRRVILLVDLEGFNAAEAGAALGCAAVTARVRLLRARRRLRALYERAGGA